MSFNIVYSHSLDGLVTVKVPTVALDGATTVNEAPFRLQIKTEGQANHSFEIISSNNWTAQPNGDFTVYTRKTQLSANQTFELYPIAGSSPTSEFYFPPTGFNPPSATSYSVNVTQGWDNTAPTLAANGIQEVNFNADNSSLSANGRESAYTVSFREPVNLPLLQGQSLFSGAPLNSTFSITPMMSSAAASSGVLLTDLWHVKVTTPNANEPVNLTLTPKLQVITYEITNARPPATGTTFFGENGATPTHWAKVTFDGDLYEGRVFGSEPLNVIFMGPDNTGVNNVSTVSVATSSSATNVLYLGFSSAPPQLQTGYEVKIYEYSSFASPLGGMITDSSNNLMEYASVANTTSPMEPLVSVLTNGTIEAFVSQGTSNGFDVLDMRALSGRLLVEADFNFLTVYDQDGDLQEKDIYFYDKYILNDRAVDDRLTEADWEDEYPDVTRFFGSNNSEYVVVGDGGGNELYAGNQPSGSSVRETDIVDYTRFTSSGASGSGVTIDLGNSVSKFVDVTESIYNNTINTIRIIDKIAGFEGVVGSAGNDVISGSNTGNYLHGGAGDDILRGYSLDNASDFGGSYSAVNGDLLYDEGFLLDELEFYGGNKGRFEQAYFADSSDMLVGGAGMDTLYGGAGSDFLIDLDAAVMWGSDMVTDGVLRNNNDSSLAERDAFMVRGSPTETATIENFHLSKNGTGLAGRSYDSHDSIIFSADIGKLIRDAYDTTNGGSTELGEGLFGRFLNDVTYKLEAGMGDDLYHYVYDNLTFTQTRVSTNDMELTATFRDKTLPAYTAKIGEVIIADLVTAMGEQNPDTLRFKNQAEVVELAWLADSIVNTPEKFNPKMDLDMINRDGGLGWSFNDMEIAIALELLQAGTVREANDYGVMASNLEDLSLDERIFNPGEASDTILGSAGKDSYEFIVQDFVTSATTAPKTYNTGNDTIFDIGGNDDTLAFSEAKINELTFSAVQVGRESGRNSLRVDYRQTLDPDNPNQSSITNRGEITLKGQFREGGRQATEFVEVSDGGIGIEKYAMAKTVYEYDRKGYVIAGSEKHVANDTFNAIMVGRTDGAEEFVFKASDGSTKTQQKASIAGYSAGDKIDISAYVDAYGSATHVLAVDGKSAVVTFDKTTTNSVDFRLELAFQESVVPRDLEFLYGTP